MTVVAFIGWANSTGPSAFIEGSAESQTSMAIERRGDDIFIISLGEEWDAGKAAQIIDNITLSAVQKGCAVSGLQAPYIVGAGS